MMKRPPKDVGKALDAGYQPMFMTGPEIKENFVPLRGDKRVIKKPDAEITKQHVDFLQPNQNTHREETDSEMWDRKLAESKQTGEERHGELAFHLGEPQKRGITRGSTLEGVAQHRGLPGHVSLQAEPDWKTGKREILGGHHRIALSSEQFKNHIFPVKYYDSISDAARDKGYT